jgi:hypothetical protein
MDMLRNDAPLCPLKGFALNFSMVLGLLGLVATYAIILLQFKMEENKN